jgi:hypothetical protein
VLERDGTYFYVKKGKIRTIPGFVQAWQFDESKAEWCQRRRKQYRDGEIPVYCATTPPAWALVTNSVNTNLLSICSQRQVSPLRGGITLHLPDPENTKQDCVALSEDLFVAS